MANEFKAYVFDAYGTLFDVHSAVQRHAGNIGPDADKLSATWRAKQLEYSWVHGLCEHYRDFWLLTEDALEFALCAVPSVNCSVREDLLQAYRELDCYPEVPAVLGALRQGGAKTAILSNGSPKMLEDAVNSAGIGQLLNEVISVDRLQTFKTRPQVYAMASELFDCDPGAVSFQSSNRWDIAGAKAFGFRCAWINRTNQPDEYKHLAPDQVLGDLNGLL